MNTGTLSATHRQMLFTESGISEEVITARGYVTVMDRAEARQLGFGKARALVPALLIPLWTVDGEVGNYQLRPDAPRRKKGKVVKYEMPWGSRMQLDINPLARPWLRDMTRPLLITEGSKKADSAISRGLLGISLQGVTGWRGRDNGDAVAELPDWEASPF